VSKEDKYSPKIFVKHNLENTVCRVKYVKREYVIPPPPLIDTIRGDELRRKKKVKH
jgi:hypothetical protein